jgi:hypothetical protein
MVALNVVVCLALHKILQYSFAQSMRILHRIIKFITYTSHNK